MILRPSGLPKYGPAFHRVKLIRALATAQHLYFLVLFPPLGEPLVKLPYGDAGGFSPVEEEWQLKTSTRLNLPVMWTVPQAPIPQPCYGAG